MARTAAQPSSAGKYGRPTRAHLSKVVLVQDPVDSAVRVREQVDLLMRIPWRPEQACRTAQGVSNNLCI